MRSLAGVFAFTVTDRLRATVMFAAGIVAVSAMYVSVFPSMQEQMVGYADALPEGLAAFIGDDFATAAGYLHSTIFTVLGPVLMVAAAVNFGAGTIAGEEEARTLPLLLSLPASRAGIALRKLAGISFLLTVLAGVLFLTLLVLVGAFGLEVPGVDLLAGAVHLHALTIFVATISFGVGAATGRRWAAIGAGVSVVVLGFVMDGIGSLVAALDVLQQLSPFYWYAGSEPVRTGFAWGGLVLLYGVAAVAAGLGIWRFARRDLR